MGTPTTVRVKGMHCASCVKLIEKTVSKQPGVKNIAVNYGTETAKIEFDENTTSIEQLSQSIAGQGYTFIAPDSPATSKKNGEVSNSTTAAKREKIEEIAAMRRQVFTSLPLVAVSIFMMVWDTLESFGKIGSMPRILEVFLHHLLPIMATYMLFVVGKPYLKGALNFFRTGRANMDTLIGIGTSAAFLYSFIVTAFEEALASLLDVE